MTLVIDPSPEPLVNAALITFNVNDVLLGLIIVLLLVLSALFAGAEVAFFSISKSEQEQLKKNMSRGAKIAEKLLEKPRVLLATILIAKNFLNVSFVIFSGVFLMKVLSFLNINMLSTHIISITIITLFLLFVGESYPKTLAYRNKAAYIRHISLPIYLFQITPPFSWLKVPLAKSSGILERRAKKKGIKISQDTLETVLTLSQDSNTSTEEYAILKGALKFGDIDVKQIMCPRIDVVGIDEKSNLEELMKVVIDAGYSRLPVFRESFDDVVGILFVKDLLPYLTLGNEFNWRELIREPFFVPENKKIDDLLKEFQNKKVHLAIVIDEYGGSCGIVTLEDVLEEIVGEITDEFDEDDPPYLQISESTYLFEGRISLADFYKTLNIDGRDFESIKEDAESLGGFIVQTAGKILKNNDSIVVGNIQLVVESSDKKRIKSVRAIVH